MTRIIFIILLFIMTYSDCTAKEPKMETIRSGIAGSWYTADPDRLSKQIGNMLDSVSIEKEYRDPLLLIVPHAGYQYSGKTAAYAYKALQQAVKKGSPKEIIVLGPSHRVGFRGCIVMKADFFETPLGKIRLSRDSADRLASEKYFQADNSAFKSEHSIEIQFPFLQHVFKEKLSDEISLLPILVGEVNGQEQSIAESIACAIDKNSVIVISSDFTHYGPNYGYLPFRHSKNTAADLKKLDLSAADFILKKDLAGFTEYLSDTGATICGRNPIKIALSFPVTDFSASLLNYETSGRTTGDYENSVSYVSIIACGKMNMTGKKENRNTGFSRVEGFTELTADEKIYLLKLARDNIKSWLFNKRGIDVKADEVPETLKNELGVFVTLNENHQLRGCIGYIEGRMPLYQAVIENSYNAAFTDPRFDQLQKSEYDDLDIEISVLTVPRLIKSVDEIRPGVHGLIIEKGGRRGLLLPQVAVEYKWDKKTFLEHTCMKAGLQPDAWKDGSTKIYSFQAIVFGEGNLK